MQYPAENVLIAARLRRETTMTLIWIADRVRMSVPGQVAHLVYWQGRKAVACDNTDPCYDFVPTIPFQRTTIHLCTSYATET